MPPSVCSSCHSLLRQRLRVRISYLQHLRRSSTVESLSWYNDTTAPTPLQLQAAEKFFLTHKPRKLWTATEWRRQNDAANTSTGLIPEVAFLGRSNVGKSSLLNALLVCPGLNHVGPRPGKTTTMHAWALAPTDPKTGGAIRGMKGDMETKCAVLDMPGYGHASHADWGEEILAYLKHRKQLKRVFVLVDGQHSLKKGDLTMLRLLRKQGISTQVVASKCDKIGAKDGEDMVKNLWTRVQGEVAGPGLGILGEVLAVGSLGDGRKNDRVNYKDMSGVQEVQWAILRATGLDQYAMSNAGVEPRTKSPAVNQSESGENEPSSTATNSYNPLTESQHHADVPFSWPAKLRQSPKISSTAASTSSTLSSLKPINPPASISELLASLSSGQSRRSVFISKEAGDKLDLHRLGKMTVRGREVNTYTSGNSTAPSTLLQPEQSRVGPLVGGVAELEAVLAKGTNPTLKSSGGRRQATTTQKKPPKKSTARKAPRLDKSTHKNAQDGPPTEPWTGSAVGGMADLEAMMERTGPPTKGGGRKKGKRASSVAPGFGNFIHQDNQRIKEPWTGSAVGGMAELEDMMARTVKPAAARGRKKKNW